MTEDEVPQGQFFRADELAWQRVSRERNIWESPTGERRAWPRGKQPGFIVLKEVPSWWGTKGQ